MDRHSEKKCQSDAVHEISYRRVGPLGGKLSLFTRTGKSDRNNASISRSFV